MATKNSSSVLVSGLGMGMAFIQSLVNEIVDLGGFKEMLHPLTREHGRPIVKKLAEIIVKSEWKIPRSLVERLTAEKSRTDYKDTYLEYDKHFRWDIIDLDGTFGIPVTQFSNESGSERLPIPPEVASQIVGQKIVYPVIVDWNNEPHVLVEFCEEEGTCKVGEIANVKLLSLGLSPAKYFDLER